LINLRANKNCTKDENLRSVIVMCRFLTLQAHAYICENISGKLIILDYRRVLLNGRILQYMNRP